MNTPTTKIKGYKQVGLEVYRYNEKEKRYHCIGANAPNTLLQKFVDEWTLYQARRINQLKDKLK